MLVSCVVSFVSFHKVTKMYLSNKANIDLKPVAAVYHGSPTAKLGCRAQRVGRAGSTTREARGKTGLGSWSSSQFLSMAGVPLECTVSQSAIAVPNA